MTADTSDTSNPLHQRALRVARAAGTIAVVAGSAVLLGWLLDVPILTRPLDVAASMKANTATAILLSGIALRALLDDRYTRIATVIGLCISVLGLATLGQYVFGWNLGIDQFLFADTDLVATSAPGRMAPATAFCLIALGLALTSTASHAPAWLTQTPALAVVLVSAAASIGYLYDINALYGIGVYTAMAVHTASLLLLLALGILCSRPARGLMAPIISPEIEGTMTRQFLLAGAAVPLALGWLVLTGEGTGLYRVEFSVGLMVMGTMGVLSVVIWAGAGSLQRLRTESESKLRAANDTLEYQVARQTKELARREKEFRLVVEEAHDGFLAMDSKGRILEINGRTEDMFGWPRSELVGRDAGETIIPPRYREAYRQWLKTLSGVGGPVLDEEVRARALHRDGHELPVALAISAVWFDDEWRFNAFIRDLTQAKAAEQQLKNAVSAKEALLKEVHHRVKNNLQVISSFLRLQARATRDPAAADALRQSEERVLSMALLHENLYRADDVGRVDFAQYLSRLATELLRTYAGENGRITMATASNLPDLEIDRAVPLGLLVNELVTNALKHAFAGDRKGRVSVDVSRQSGVAILTVKDDGVGFQGRRDDPAQSIGLEIIDALSRQLGGVGRFRQDAGTEFTLEFPAA